MIMTNQQRKKEMQKLKKKGLTLKEIGQKFNLTSERIRQILVYETKYCSKHQRYYKKDCCYCKVEKKEKFLLKQFSKDGILDVIREARKRGRKGDQVIKRRLLVKLLKDKYKLPIFRIGKLLGRDHTTIIALYGYKRTKRS